MRQTLQWAQKKRTANIDLEVERELGLARKTWGEVKACDILSISVG